MTNVERGVQNLEFVLQQLHTAIMALTSCEANDIVANSRKNPVLMQGEDCRNVMIRRQVEENETCCERSFLLYGALFWIERCECYVSRYGKKFKDTFEEEIKLACLGALAPEELGETLDTQLESLANI